MKDVDTLSLFKALADASRLQIIKSLTKEDMYVEQLAERLGLSSATISSHMKKLEDVGAVTKRREQYYNTYALNTDIFTPRIIDLIQNEREDTGSNVREAAYRQKILTTFMKNGKITRMPTQLKKKLILVEEISKAFTLGRSYTEKEMNLIIADVFDDFCMVRRFFVDYGMFTRENGVYIKQHDKISAMNTPAAY